jgi:POT family proton-dependent oligopeptide transporter
MTTTSTDPEDSTPGSRVSQASSTSDTKSEHNGPELRRVRGSIPWQLWIVAVIGFWERATFWGRECHRYTAS